MNAHGYQLVKRTGCNNWHIPDDQQFELSSNWERVKILRKMFLGTAFRKLKAVLAGGKIQ
jgi:hypothetical protein